MMRKFTVRGAVALLAMLLALSVLWSAGAEAPSEPPQGAVHNYIMLIDNSRSTTGSHSLGEATDPKGLRFDAARLVYQNVVSSAATGARGQLGVVVFCGTKNCVSYGPMAIDDAAMDEVIGSKLNAASNAARRDVYTDIRTALQTADDMMAGFEGPTSVILLTDGVNDLTNRSDPFNRPENIEANEQSVELARQMHEAGADFYVIALTDRESVADSDPFMVFINTLAQAGGGEAQADGSMSNVLMATQDDLNSKLVQMLIRAESAPEAMQTIVGYTPIRQSFTVPYDGITDATVNITFMPEDKALLEKVELTGPDGEAVTLWDNSTSHEERGITVTEDRSYIMLDIPQPAAGEWTVAVTSREADTRVLINAVVRLNHNLRLQVDAQPQIIADETARIEARFQRFDGETFEDLAGSDIYSQSEAALIVATPAGNRKKVSMKLEGDRYSVNFRARTQGIWTARVQVQNPYVTQMSEEITFEVIAPTPEPTAEPTPEPEIEPTPEIAEEPTPQPMLFVVTEAPTPSPTPRPTAVPTPTPSPTPQVAQIDRIDLRIEPSVTTEAGETFLTPGSVTFSWQVEGETDDVQAYLTQNGKNIGTLPAGVSFDSAFFKEGQEYGFAVSVMPKNGALAGVEPIVASRSFRAAPVALSEEEITLQVSPLTEDADETIYVDRNAEQYTLSWAISRNAQVVEAALLEDGQVLIEGLVSGDSVQRSLLKDGAKYELRVSALPEYGEAVGVEPTTASLPFELYPLPQAVEGLTLQAGGGDSLRTRDGRATLTWSYDSGSVDHFELVVLDPSGAEWMRQTLPAAARSYDLKLPGQGDYRATLTAVPRYAEGQEANVQAGPVTLHGMSLAEKYWPFMAGGAAALLLGAAAVLLVLRERNARHVVGLVRVRCEALGLDQTLSLQEDRKGVKVGDPITRHPALAKLKGKTAYKMLENVRLDNVQTDHDGRAPEEGEDTPVQHRPNVRVVRLTYTDPETKQREVCCVGRYDVGESTLQLRQGGQSAEFTFSGV